MNSNVEEVRKSLRRATIVAIIHSVFQITLAVVGEYYDGRAGTIGFSLGVGLMSGVIAVMCEGIRWRFRGANR